MAVDVSSPPLGNDREEVLIERDGVFEVVSALEVHAERDRMDEVEQVSHVASPDSNTFENSSDVTSAVHPVRLAEDEPGIEGQQEFSAGTVSRPPKDPGGVDQSPAITDKSEINHSQTQEPVTQSYDPPLSASDNPDKPIPSSTVTQERLEAALPSLSNGSAENTPTAVPLQEQPTVTQPPSPSSEEPKETTTVSLEQQSVKEERTDERQGSEPLPAATDQPPQQATEQSSLEATGHPPQDATDQLPQEATDQLSQKITDPKPGTGIPSQQFLDHDPIAQPDTLSSPQPATYIPQHKAKSGSLRTKSAPMAELAQAKGAGSTNQEKRKMNELAFKAWLSKKDKEVLKRHELERKQGASPQEIERKKEENERAFQHWLAAKRRQASAHPNLQCPPAAKQDVTGEDKEKINLDAWQAWLTRKMEQKKRESQLESLRRKELKESSRRADPDVSRRAYKEWLWQKTCEARELKRRREQYMKAFYRESHQLAQSMKRSQKYTQR